MLKLNRDKTELLVIGPKHKVKFLKFAVTDLSDDIRSIQNLDVFKNKIKRLFFREAFLS